MTMFLVLSACQRGKPAAMLSAEAMMRKKLLFAALALWVAAWLLPYPRMSLRELFFISIPAFAAAGWLGFMRIDILRTSLATAAFFTLGMNVPRGLAGLTVAKGAAVPALLPRHFALGFIVCFAAALVGLFLRECMEKIRTQNRKPHSNAESLPAQPAATTAAVLRRCHPALWAAILLCAASCGIDALPGAGNATKVLLLMPGAAAALWLGFCKKNCFYAGAGAALYMTVALLFFPYTLLILGLYNYPPLIAAALHIFPPAFFCGFCAACSGWLIRLCADNNNLGPSIDYYGVK